jgi:ABC-2 type transport system ATP-binding protein
VRFRGLVSEAARGRTVVLSTHQTEDVAAVCSQVVVVDRGHALFAGTVRELVDRARGRVWVDERQDPRAQVSWLLGSGLYHHLGDPPPEARLVDPGLEDAYLLLLGAQEPQRSAVR